MDAREAGSKAGTGMVSSGVRYFPRLGFSSSCFWASAQSSLIIIALLCGMRLLVAALLLLRDPA